MKLSCCGKSDGRRVFTVVRQWKRRFEAGATAAVATNEDVVPVSALREAHQRIRELERLLGKKQMEFEILRAALEVAKKSVVAQRVRTVTQLPVVAIWDSADGAPDGLLRRI